MSNFLSVTTLFRQSPTSLPRRRSPFLPAYTAPVLGRLGFRPSRAATVAWGPVNYHRRPGALPGETRWPSGQGAVVPRPLAGSPLMHVLATRRTAPQRPSGGRRVVSRPRAVVLFQRSGEEGWCVCGGGLCGVWPGGVVWWERCWASV